MPSRVVRGEINESESMARVSMAAAYTFTLLITAVDDFGRMDARPMILKSRLFPVRQDVLPGDALSWIQELAAGDDPPVMLYEVDGRAYLQLVNWEKHRGKGRRGTNSKCPSPEEGHALPRIPEDCHADPPGGRGTGDEKRGTKDGGRGECEGESTAADAAPSGGQDGSPEKPKDKRKRSTRAPEDLNRAQWIDLDIWISQKQIWLENQQERQQELVDACLDHHRAKGTTSTDWVLNVRNWIRNEVKFGRAGGNGSGQRKGELTAATERLLAVADAADAADRERAQGEGRAHIEDVRQLPGSDRGS